MEVISGLGPDQGQVPGVRPAVIEAARGVATGRYLGRERNQKRRRRRRTTRTKRRTRLTRSGRRTTVGLVTLIPLSLTRKASPAARK